MVADLGINLEAIDRSYCNRGFPELLLRELKDSDALAHTPRSFWAKAADLELVPGAFVLVLAFRCLGRPPGGATLEDFRMAPGGCLSAAWVGHGHRNILWLPARYPHAGLVAEIHWSASVVEPLM